MHRLYHTSQIILFYITEQFIVISGLLFIVITSSVNFISKTKFIFMNGLKNEDNQLQG